MNKKLPPHPTQQCTRSLLPELFLSLHQLIMLYPRKSYTLGGGLAWFAYFGRSSVFSVQTVNVSYDKVYIEVVVVGGGCDDKYVLLLLDLVRFFGLWPCLENKVVVFFDDDYNSWRRWLLEASGGGVLLPTGSAHCVWPWLAGHFGRRPPLFSFFPFLLFPRRCSFIVVLFLRLGSVVVRSCCIVVVAIWRLWWSCVLMLMVMATIVVRC